MSDDFAIKTEYPPEKKLLASILERTFLDLLLIYKDTKNPSQNTHWITRLSDRRAIYRWFFHDKSESYGSLDFVCHHLNLDKEIIRKKVKDAIKEFDFNPFEDLSN